MNPAGNRILARMLDRLFAAIVSGPSLNCRPHSSRQRVDLMQLGKLADREPAAALHDLLSDGAAFELTSRLKPPARLATQVRFRKKSEGEGSETPLDPSESAAQKAWTEQNSLLSKLRVLIEEARTYENDTGAYVLNVGYPLVSLPPGASFGKHQGTRRILAPIAFIPVAVTLKAGASAGVRVECKSDEVDRVVANDALLAWIEQNTGKKAETLFTDDEGVNTWREIAELVRHACAALKLDVPALFQADTLPATLPLEAAPKAEEGEAKPAIINAAVLGLFPMANQGLLRDTQAMLAGESVRGPVESFLRADVSLDASVAEQAPEEPTPRKKRPKVFATERLVAPADPCQARAVALARTSAGLVVHGPPGTGKSQTITNIIGDHLARGERVLFVCEKRTALDVVANRLTALGLGSLCAVVHDPQRDQRELYMSIREQLETLAEVKTHPMAEQRVAKIDQELGTLHAELTGVHDALSRAPDGEEMSLHALVGQWLALTAEGSATALDGLEGVSLHELEPVLPVVREALQRALDVSYPTNEWSRAAGVELATLVSRPMDHFRGLLARCVEAAKAADATIDPRIPPFGPAVPLGEQAAKREQLRAALTHAFAEATRETRTYWANMPPADVAVKLRLAKDARPALETFRAGSPDLELLASVQGVPTVGVLSQQIGALEAYLPTASKWWGFLAFGKKSAAARVLTPLGLPVNAAAATRGRDFLTWLRAMLILNAVAEQLEGVRQTPTLPDHLAVERRFQSHAAVLGVLELLTDPALESVGPLVREALRKDAAPELLEGLRLAGARAKALGVMEEAASGTAMFSGEWLTGSVATFRGGAAAEPTFSALLASLRTLEDVLRIREALAGLPKPLSAATESLIAASTDPVAGIRALEREVTSAEITRRLADNPKLQSLDPRRVQTQFDRYRELDEEKRQKVRDAVLHRWTARAKERLLASTGSRLSPEGADVRRRLTTRGRNAMRLRQVLALGRGMERGDPLMELRPVWMASPETVAQIFPREQLFDVVIFDEASQCRLEEALPVLTRGKRVVIAGDPKQLPPTRFFETTLAVSENEEIESDQQLFEAQQSEVEDLLGAALGLDIQQSYLDVHYRSRNSDLIEFSNEHFYARRLQAIPGHPRNRVRYAPLTLYHVGGTYEDRTNEREADRVCQIVRDLLKRADPPSIGIGCFNLAQRDLILEKLDELAAADPAFATSLAKARELRRKGAFEGLFVKNLENVQGDERDHIIISTTYGPAPDGRFYRRFGPLAQPGGGRRLNVLVTRARDEVHLVTSIPREVYTALPPIPQGQQPGGGWLLMSYLLYAETLAAKYSLIQRALELDADARENPSPSIPDPNVEVKSPQPMPTDEVIIEKTRAPSTLAASLAGALKTEQHVGSIVHWGNDGFCVDVAVRHPREPDGVTIGVLCDTTRFPLADDPVEWDIFRTDILTGQGWNLLRLWSPVLFRDPRGHLEEIARRADAELARGNDKSAE
ncbi:MAG TPA: AAA domain-containing protein [Phycisphaerales bacterium]|nr:AAA domain-containing protein [Phycisphaerales bacterium]